MRTLVIFLLPNLVISLQTTFHGYFYVLWKQGLCDRSLNLSPPEHLAELSQLVQTYRRAAVLDVTESVISCRSMYLCRGERSQNIPRRMKHSIILLLHVTEHTEVFQKWSYPQNLKLCVQTRHTIDNVFLYTSSKEKRICRKARTWYVLIFQSEDSRQFGLVVCMLTVHTTLKSLF